MAILVNKSRASSSISTSSSSHLRGMDSLMIMTTASRRPRRREHPRAIFMKALSLTRRDGPDVFQRLKIEEKTTHGIVC